LKIVNFLHLTIVIHYHTSCEEKLGFCAPVGQRWQLGLV
jgi:hypothetical protein